MQAETQNRQNDSEAQPAQQLLSWGEWWEHFEDLPEPAEDEIFLRAAQQRRISFETAPVTYSSC